MCSEMTTRAAGRMMRIEPQSKTGRMNLGRARIFAVAMGDTSRLPGTQMLRMAERA